MADLTNKVISSNFQKLLNIDGNIVQDGTGSAYGLRMTSSRVGINIDPRDGTTLNVGGDIRASGNIIGDYLSSEDPESYKKRESKVNLH